VRFTGRLTGVSTQIREALDAEIKSIPRAKRKYERDATRVRTERPQPSSGWMFASSSNDTPISLNNVRTRLIQPALKKGRLQWKGYHAFRRGLATVLYSLGVPDKIIQRILRHSSLNVTMSSYVKTAAEDVKQEMKKLEKAWKETKPKAASQVAVPVAAAPKRELYCRWLTGVLLISSLQSTKYLPAGP